MRLIDADKLQRDMMDMVASGMYVLEDMIDAVIEAPTIDAVPVVRCEKCACHSDLLLKGWEDTVWCNLFHLYRCKDSFCNCGRVE